MEQFWRDLSERERLLIIVGSGFAVLFVVLQLVLSPTLSWREDQRRDMASARGLYELVAEAAPLGVASTATVSAGDGPVRNVVSQTASSAGVTIIFINARGDQAVDVNIAAVSPDALFQWLSVLRSQHNIVVDTADIARETGNPEMVRAQLTMLQRGGA